MEEGTTTTTNPSAPPSTSDHFTLRRSRLPGEKYSRQLNRSLSFNSLYSVTTIDKGLRLDVFPFPDRYDSSSSQTSSASSSIPSVSHAVAALSVDPSHDRGGLIEREEPITMPAPHFSSFSEEATTPASAPIPIPARDQLLITYADLVSEISDLLGEAADPSILLQKEPSIEENSENNTSLTIVEEYLVEHWMSSKVVELTAVKPIQSDEDTSSDDQTQPVTTRTVTPDGSIFYTFQNFGNLSSSLSRSIDTEPSTPTDAFWLDDIPKSSPYEKVPRILEGLHDGDMLVVEPGRGTVTSRRPSLEPAALYDEPVPASPVSITRTQDFGFYSLSRIRPRHDSEATTIPESVVDFNSDLRAMMTAPRKKSPLAHEDVNVENGTASLPLSTPEPCTVDLVATTSESQLDPPSHPSPPSPQTDDAPLPDASLTRVVSTVRRVVTLERATGKPKSVQVSVTVTSVNEGGKPLADSDATPASIVEVPKRRRPSGPRAFPSIFPKAHTLQTSVAQQQAASSAANLDENSKDKLSTNNSAVLVPLVAVDGKKTGRRKSGIAQLKEFLFSKGIQLSSQ